MAFRDVLKQKVPAHLKQTPAFSIILRMIKNAKISSSTSLRHWLNVELQKCKNDLKECGKAGPTMNRKRVRYAQRIKLLKLTQTKILPYVK